MVCQFCCPIEDEESIMMITSTIACGGQTPATFNSMRLCIMFSEEFKLRESKSILISIFIPESNKTKFYRVAILLSNLLLKMSKANFFKTTLVNY